MFRFLKRTAETTIKLPFAVVWDIASLGNMGEGSSTVKVIQEHKDKKQVDDVLEIIKQLCEMNK